jgi:hypothetical protein
MSFFSPTSKHTRSLKELPIFDSKRRMAMDHNSWYQGSLFLFLCFIGFLTFAAEAAVKKYQFDVGILIIII